MKYMGSKRRIAKEILPIILAGRKPGQYYVEPFCGGCNTLKLVDGKRIGNDLHPELIAMYKALQLGWLPPKSINEDAYKRIKNTGPPELKGYVGFTHSFGSVYFSTYRRNADGFENRKVALHGSFLKGAYKNIENVGRVSYNGIIEDAKLLKNVLFFSGHYYDFKIPKKSIVYCDPPYAGTAGYNKVSFNSYNFFEWCRQIASDGCTVFISEYSAPIDFKCVWQKKVRISMNNSMGDPFYKTEKLFTL